MKNIFATITYVADQIKEAITGHKKDKQAHPDIVQQLSELTETDETLSNQIKVLSSCFYWDLAELECNNTVPIHEIIKKMKVNSTLTSMVYENPDGIYPNNYGVLIINKCHETYGTVTFKSLFSAGVWEQPYRSTTVGGKQLATTDKTEILLSPKPNITITQQKNVKINNIFYM